MIRKIHTIKINLPGGIVAVDLLKTILFAAEKARIEEVSFGTRQQMYLLIQDAYLEAFVIEMHLHNIALEEDEEQYPNIMSSFVTQGIFASTEWLTGKIYKDVIDSYDYLHTLKVNLVDNEQSLIPLFTGNINFISSELADNWFLFVRFPKTNIVFPWKGLVASADVAPVSKAIEEQILQHKELFYGQSLIDGELLFSKIQQEYGFTFTLIEQELESKDFRLPYYEGFNQYGSKMWLGIYRREETYPLLFLRDLCDICLQTKINYLYTTSWKSIIFKDIQIYSRKLWENVLGKYRINVRHASNELNWQIGDLSEEGLNLKRYVIRQFDKDDVRTFGLCFAVKVRNGTGLFGSVIISRQPNNAPNQRRSLDRYDILYSKNFDPNSKDYIIYRKDLLKEHLGTYLVSLCKFYYEEQMNQVVNEVVQKKPGIMQRN